MNYKDIFIQYYSLYRAEASVPDITDDEYVVGIALANEAIRRWSTYEGVYWNELFTTAQTAGDGVTTLAEGTTAYAAPGDMKEAGGHIRVFNGDGRTMHYVKIIQPQQAQFLTDTSNYAYFTGDPNHGFVLHMNPAPTDQFIGANIDYVYYKKPTIIEDGDSVPEMADPMFIVHRMLANRFRSSRNPYYASAGRDAENVLQSMKMANISGTVANPWTLFDPSGSVWGK